MWVFVACVSLCLTHSADVLEDFPYYTAESIDGSHEGEHCPIIEAISYVLPERIVSVSQMSGDVQALFAPSVSLARYLLHCRAWLSVPLSASDPPSERLCILRI